MKITILTVLLLVHTIAFGMNIRDQVEGHRIDQMRAQEAQTSKVKNQIEKPIVSSSLNKEELYVPLESSAAHLFLKVIDDKIIETVNYQQLEAYFTQAAPGTLDDLPSYTNQYLEDWKCEIHYPRQDRIDPTPVPLKIENVSLPYLPPYNPHNRNDWRIQDIACVPSFVDQNNYPSAKQLKEVCRKNYEDNYILLNSHRDDFTQHFVQTIVSAHDYLTEFQIKKWDSRHLIINWRGEQLLSKNVNSTSVYMLCVSPEDMPPSNALPRFLTKREKEKSSHPNNFPTVEIQENWFQKALIDLSRFTPEVRRRHQRYALYHEIAGRIVEQGQSNRATKIKPLKIKKIERPRHIHLAEEIKKACKEMERAGRICGPGREIFYPTFNPLGEEGNGIKQPFFRKLKKDEQCMGRSLHRITQRGKKIYTCSAAL